MKTLDDLVDAVWDIPGMRLTPEDARVTVLDLYADLAGWHVGMGTASRFLANDTHPSGS